jgi:hypothetical protein
VDRAGNALSNSPPVTLTIESGPGEFPTGPSIAFAPDSDIAIRDGEAAMEFRSYYAGETVIRATSSGLKDATLKITTLGSPKFTAGKTPPVQPHPYVRFTGSTAAVSAPLADSIFGVNNPVLTSSEAAGHSASLGNDGSTATFWQPQDNDANAWWQADLERTVTIRQTKITFPTTGNYRYKIETSTDGEHWTLAADQSRTVSTDPIRTDVFVQPVSAHLLRVTFVGKPAAIAEMEAVGRLTAQ